MAGTLKTEVTMTTHGWDPSLETGDALIDSEHKRFFALANELQSNQGHDAAFLRAAVDDVIQYARHHFGHEEELMGRFDYPDTEHHMRLHNDFAEEAYRLGCDCVVGTCTSEDALREFLTGWLHRHIDAEDRRLVEHIQSHGHPAAG